MLFEERLSLAQSIVDFMKQKGLKRFNASQTSTFQPDEAVGMRVKEKGEEIFLDRFPNHLDNTLQRLRKAESDYSSYFIKNENFTGNGKFLVKDFNFFSKIMAFFRELHFSIEHANMTWESLGGSCSGFSSIVASLLMLLNIPCEMIAGEAKNFFQGIALGHMFVVIGRDPNSKLRDIRTWGNDFVIIDGWDHFKVAGRKDILDDPEKYLFFQPEKYDNTWSWRIHLHVDEPSRVCKGAPNLIAFQKEYDRLKTQLLPELQIFASTLALSQAKISTSSVAQEAAEKSKQEGNRLFSDKKYKEALEKYDQALRINPFFDSAWFNKGLVHKNLGEPKKAIAAFKQALKINPNYKKASDNLASIIKEQSEESSHSVKMQHH